MREMVSTRYKHMSGTRKSYLIAVSLPLDLQCACQSAWSAEFILGSFGFFLVVLVLSHCHGFKQFSPNVRAGNLYCNSPVAEIPTL